MQEWIENQDLTEEVSENSVHKKMELLQNLLYNKYEEFFPERNKTISSEDQPFFNDRLMKLKRRKVREFRKNRKSIKWNKMNKFYQTELDLAKRNFYDNKIKKKLLTPIRNFGIEN